jgi:hypothetical protein
MPGSTLTLTEVYHLFSAKVAIVVVFLALGAQLLLAQIIEIMYLNAALYRRYHRRLP